MDELGESEAHSESRYQSFKLNKNNGLYHIIRADTYQTCAGFRNARRNIGALPARLRMVDWAASQTV